MSTLNRFDGFIKNDEAAALVLREALMPVEGADSIFFPPTYAAGGTFAGGYNIDTIGNTQVCLVDSVGSQANRIEPIFGRPPYDALVPQIVIKAGSREVNLLEAGHRAGDAIVRSSALQEVLQGAFRALLKGNAVPMAKIAPTSLVFGVWDSRDTQAKSPRLLASTIRAWDVHKLTRSAQYVPAASYVEEGLLEEPADKKAKDAYSVRGFGHVPATATHGGILARGGIRRDCTLGLAALRLLQAGGDKDQTLVLRRYLLGLSLTAFTANVSSHLRQGCMLVPDLNRPDGRQLELVHSNGKREGFGLTHDEALSFATEAAKAFGVGENRTVDFDKERAKRDLAGDEKDSKGKEKGKGKGKKEADAGGKA